MITCLFIGGGHDGGRIEVSSPKKQQEIRMPVRHALDTTPATIGTTPATIGTFHVQSYMRHTMHDFDGSEIYVYMCGGNVNQPLRQLVDGYRKNLAKDVE